jgi:hypothetical protein
MFCELIKLQRVREAFWHVTVSLECVCFQVKINISSPVQKRMKIGENQNAFCVTWIHITDRTSLPAQSQDLGVGFRWTLGLQQILTVTSICKFCREYTALKKR